MIPPQHPAAHLEDCFNAILRDKMAAIPILNHHLRVEAVGFHPWEGHHLGVLVTPWLMSLMMLPGEQCRWAGAALGSRHIIPFPSRDYPFILNEFDGLEPCLTHGLYSPMFDFLDHDSAVAMARVILTQLHQPPEAREQPSEQERRITQYMNKESMFEPPPEPPAEDNHKPTLTPSERMTRRDLLFGALRTSANPAESPVPTKRPPNS